MRKPVLALVILSALAFSQAAFAAAGAGPTAVIETTAGKLTCTLFPDVAPIGVANFIGLSNGTKIGPVRSPIRRSMVCRSMTGPFSIGSSRTS